MQYSWLQHPSFFWTQSFIFQLIQWSVWNVLKSIRFDEERNRYVISNSLIMQLLFQFLQSTLLTNGELQRKVTVWVTIVKKEYLHDFMFVVVLFVLKLIYQAWDTRGVFLTNFQVFHLVMGRVSNAWYYFINKMILEGEIKNARMSSFSPDFHTLIKH